jgi:hypothetical protein
VSHGLSRNNAGATKLVAGTGDAGIQTDSVYEKVQIVRTGLALMWRTVREGSFSLGRRGAKTGRPLGRVVSSKKYVRPDFFLSVQAFLKGSFKGVDSSLWSK